MRDTSSDAGPQGRVAGGGRAVLLAVSALLLVVQLWGLSASFAMAEPAFPALTGRVVDEAGMLKAGDRQLIADRLAQLEEKSTDQLVLVTLSSLQGYAIEDFGVRLARHWKIGQKGKNNGVLLIVAPKERKVRIEVGYGLEGVLTDTLAGNIVHNRILPLFRKGKMAEGIRRGVDDIIEALTGDAAAVAQRAKGAKRTGPKGIDWPALFIFSVWGFILFHATGRSLFGREGGRGGVVIVPVGETAGSGWNSGAGGSRGGFGGGGFSGGGGSFGGGGASGGW